MELPKGSLISYMANMVKSQGGINLAQGIPALNPPKALIEKLKLVCDKPIHQYAPGSGNAHLINILCEHYNTYKLAPDNLLIVNGATEAISLIFTYLFQTFQSNLSVLAFDPIYESYKNLPKIFNVPFFSFSTEKDNGIDFLRLENEIITKAIKLIMVASPGNPLGKIWTKKETHQLIDLAEKHECYIIWDAVYSTLYFDTKPYEPIDRVSDYLFYVNAFSKQLSITGWRLGYFAFNTKHRSALLNIHDYIGLCSPSVLQQAVFEYLDENNFGEKYSKTLRTQLADNYAFLCQELNLLGFKIEKAHGGYFVWCQLPEQYNNGFEFAVNLYNQQKVACVPGIHFSETGTNYIRFNIAQTKETLTEAINRIKTFMKV